MRKVDEIKEQLRQHAAGISEEMGGAPVVIIVAGSVEAGMPRCTTAYSHLSKKERGPPA